MQSEKEKKNRRKRVATQEIIQCIIYTAKIKDDEKNYGNIKFS